MREKLSTYSVCPGLVKAGELKDYYLFVTESVFTLVQYFLTDYGVSQSQL